MDYNKILEEYNKTSNINFILENDIYSYEKYLFSTKKYKNRTITEEILSLHNFDTFLQLAYPNLKDITQLKAQHIRSYQKFCIEYLKNKNKTSNKKLRAIRKFLDFITLVRNKLEYNPSTKVAYLKNEEEAPPNYVPKNELRLILNAMDNVKYGIRDKCIIKFMTLAGLQLQEVFNLRVDDLDMENKHFYLKRENTTYTFPIEDKLYNTLNDYLCLRQDFLYNSKTGYTNFLFLSHTGNKYTERAFQYKFKCALDLANINYRYTPRNLRASFAFYMAKKTNQDKLKKVLNQDKVSHYYALEITENPLKNI